MEAFWQPAPGRGRVVDERASAELLWMKSRSVEDCPTRFLVGGVGLPRSARQRKNSAEPDVAEMAGIDPAAGRGSRRAQPRIAKSLRKRRRIFLHIT